ncbi:HAMP domain-containing histidine kinase [Alicyclobacillus mali]|uniref:histidine kinase n=1 Tax=Alicyclobacillus mali (ex Roth et al. 2021) TaxID=1123961 RepID=A0ABS0F3I1_9BACL|nr:HAMP domain-containing sensor histidine kinase [Alicyclobacillus mali (ex Roth et al. 2021)]MBF8377846.1 HAMP domain-containing histidine kinase [Alicyclobacillus mali (ex Roth et al. 2021)]
MQVNAHPRVRFSLRYKIIAILFGAMLVVLALGGTLFYSVARQQMLKSADKQAQLLAQQIELEVESSEAGQAYIDNLLGNELRIASIAIEKQLPPHWRDVTNEQLRQLSAELGVSGITLLAPTADDIVGVRSSDPREIGLSTRGMGKWYIAFRDLLAGRPQASTYGTAEKNYWSGPFANAASDPSKVDKWGYYYDGTTDYIIDPFYVQTSIPGYEQVVSVNSTIRHVLATEPDILSIAVLNKTFAEKPIRYSYKGVSWIDVANQPVMYGAYRYADHDLDVKLKDRALSTGHMQTALDRVGGTTVMKAFIPESEQGSQYVVEIVMNYRLITAQLAGLLHDMAILGGALLVLTAVLSFVGAELITRPLRRITEAVDEIADRNFATHVDVARSDEIGVLAAHVNEMSEKLVEYLRELTRRERGRGVDYLVMATQALVHELGTPLAAIRQMSELLPRLEPNLGQKAREILERMRSASEYANRIARDFTAFLRNGMLTVRRRDVVRLVSDAVGLCSSMAQSRHVKLSFRNETGQRHVYLEVDEDKLFGAIVNLVRNAIDAIPDDRARREVAVTVRIEEEELHIDVIDTGVGIPRERWDQIFVPYSSTKKSGLGLGLTFCGLIAIAHGGTVGVVQSSPQGTHIRMRLPLKHEPIQVDA